MPAAIQRRCTQPGCHTLTQSGRCIAHPKLSGNKQRWDRPQIKGSTTKRGYGHEWQKLRLRVLARDNYQCQEGLRQGTLCPGEEVDHIVPKFMGGTDLMDNLEALCRCHHKEKTRAERSPKLRDILFPSFHPVSHECDLKVIVGPPGSGKTSYIKEHADPGDLVIDLDEIIAELTGLPIYHGNKGLDLYDGIKHRNSLIAGLATFKGRAWLSTTGGSPEHREYWLKLGGDLVVMRYARKQCMDRIQSDDRRPGETKAKQYKIIEKWH